MADSSGLIDGDPTRVGPYRIIERLGVGGMGVVYRSAQDEPVKRYVAPVDRLGGPTAPAESIHRLYRHTSVQPG